MAEIYIPNYMSFHNANIFLGSYQGLRFKLTPSGDLTTILAEYWYGPKCYELSKMDGKESFPLTDEGIDQMRLWLIGLSGQRGDGPDNPE